MRYYDLGIEPPVEPPDCAAPICTVPVCPVCGASTDTFYEDMYGEIVGCGECIVRRDAWDVSE